jgi:hypothetical protein
MSDDLLIDEPPVRRRFYSRWFGSAGGAQRSRFWRVMKWTGIALLLIVVLYYPIGMLMVHQINDDPNFSAPQVAPGDPQNPEAGASQAVATAAALMDREVNQTVWPANDPFFLPGWALDNMPNFQIGVRDAVKRFALELQDEIGRNRGTSAADSDLQTAASRFNYEPNLWIWNPSNPLMPTSTTEENYRQGIAAFQRYNARLAQGSATFDRRADNLLSTLDRIGKDLGAASDRTQRQIDGESGSWIDFRADDVFYLNKGLLYGNALILRDLGKDFASILREKGAQNIWDRMVSSMIEGAELEPWIVINGRPDALMQPNHLAAQGFYLIRARAQLEELNDVLIK